MRSIFFFQDVPVRHKFEDLASFLLRLFGHQIKLGKIDNNLMCRVVCNIQLITQLANASDRIRKQGE
jgi:hypothetical protein